MEEQNKLFSLAREALRKSNLKEAKTLYESLYREFPENNEAEWFYLFLKLSVEKTDEEILSDYTRASELFYPTLEYVASLEEATEKWTLALTMVKGFPHLIEVIRGYMINSISDGRTIFTMDDVIKFNYVTSVDNDTLANNIINLFGDSTPYCNWVVDIWKAKIDARFKLSQYRHCLDKGKVLWFDELAQKIKKYDPSYEMPKFKQAGIIMFGEAAREASLISPGE